MWSLYPQLDEPPLMSRGRKHLTPHLTLSNLLTSEENYRRTGMCFFALAERDVSSRVVQNLHAEVAFE